MNRTAEPIAPPPNRLMPAWRGWVARGLAPACVAVALAVLVYGLGRYGADLQRLAASLPLVGWPGLAWALAATVLSLVLRVLRWQWLMRELGHRLSWTLQTRVYMAGLALSSTPGKLGETSRAALLVPHGVPVSHTLGAFVCDRLSDLVGVAALAAASALLMGKRQLGFEVLAVTIALGSLGVAALWRADGGQGRLAGFIARWHRGPWPAWASWLGAPATAWAAAWRGTRPLGYVAIALATYGLQAWAFALIVERVHPGLSAWSCVFIFASSTLVGAASMVPGGLGTMDAALVWQLHAQGVPTEAAVVATLAARACTLWFVTLLGVGAMLSFGRRLPATP